jgi:ABC-2 type transport system permease protein
MTTATTDGRAADRHTHDRRAAFRRLLRTEALLFARTPMAVTWAALLPVIAFVALGCIPAVRQPNKDLNGDSYLGAYLPILMAFSLVMSAINLLPPTLALYREKGILRRLSTTPVPASWLLAAQAAIFAGVGLVVSIALFALGIGFDVSVPGQIVGFVLSLILLGAATLGIGLLIAAVARTGKAANAISFTLFFPLMFLAGLWVPRALMPAILLRISDYSPLGAGVRALQDSAGGDWPPTQSLLVLLVWAVVTGGLAIRYFRWQ